MRVPQHAGYARCASKTQRFSGLPSGFSRSVVCAAAAKKTKQLPLFPLNVVALPCATVPLMIFEARYDCVRITK